MRSQTRAQDFGKNHLSGGGAAEGDEGEGGYEEGYEEGSASAKPWWVCKDVYHLCGFSFFFRGCGGGFAAAAAASRLRPRPRRLKSRGCGGLTEKKKWSF